MGSESRESGSAGVVILEHGQKCWLVPNICNILVMEEVEAIHISRWPSKICDQSSLVMRNKARKIQVSKCVLAVANQYKLTRSTPKSSSQMSQRQYSAKNTRYLGSCQYYCTSRGPANPRFGSDILVGRSP